MTPTILITGASGFLGHALQRELSGFGKIVPLSHSQNLDGSLQADLRDRRQVEELIERVKPDVVVHAAAYREPDKCEDAVEETDRLNRLAVQYLVDALPDSARSRCM